MGRLFSGHSFFSNNLVNVFYEEIYFKHYKKFNFLFFVFLFYFSFYDILLLFFSLDYQLLFYLFEFSLLLPIICLLFFHYILGFNSWDQKRIVLFLLLVPFLFSLVMWVSLY